MRGREEGERINVLNVPLLLQPLPSPPTSQSVLCPRGFSSVQTDQCCTGYVRLWSPILPWRLLSSVLLLYYLPLSLSLPPAFFFEACFSVASTYLFKNQRGKVI